MYIFPTFEKKPKERSTPCMHIPVYRYAMLFMHQIQIKYATNTPSPKTAQSKHRKSTYRPTVDQILALLGAIVRLNFFSSVDSSTTGSVPSALNLSKNFLP